MKMVRDSANHRISFHVSELENLHGPVAQSESYFSQRLKIHKFRAYTHFIAGVFSPGCALSDAEGALPFGMGARSFIMYLDISFFVL